MTEKRQSEYYQAIAREFLRRRGAPLILSPLDLAVISGWEKNGVPLEVVIEGIGRAFEAIRDPARGKKGLPLSFCESQVRKAMAQHADRSAGRGRSAAPRSAKTDRVRREVERRLRALPAEEKEIRSLLEKAAGLLVRPSPDEEALERIDEEMDEVLSNRAARSECESFRRRLAAEFPGPDSAGIEAAVRTRLVKSTREKLGVPYVSLYYY
jgi:hypothetical protein